MGVSRRKQTDRAGDRHSGHCESKPRTSDAKAAPAVEPVPRLHFDIGAVFVALSFMMIPSAMSTSDAFEHIFRCRFGMIHIELHVDFQMSLDIFQSVWAIVDAPWHGD